MCLCGCVCGEHKRRECMPGCTCECHKFDTLSDTQIMKAMLQAKVRYCNKVLCEESIADLSMEQRRTGLFRVLLAEEDDILEAFLLCASALVKRKRTLSCAHSKKCESKTKSAKKAKIVKRKARKNKEEE